MTTVERTELLGWLRGKIAKAERSVAARVHGESIWRHGDDASWAAVGCHLSKEEKFARADTEARIAAKMRIEVEMFKAAYICVEGEQHES